MSRRTTSSVRGTTRANVPGGYVGAPDGLDLRPATVKSLGRAFEILEEFRRHRRPLSAHDLQMALGYPQSSARALLVSMATAGYLSFDRGTKTYFPTPRVTLLGDWIDSALFIHTNIAALMAALSLATHETITLSTQQALRMQFVHVIPAPQPIAVTLYGGQTMSLLHSAVGGAALSTKADDELAEIVRQFNRRRSPTTVVSLATVVRRAAQVRAQKFCAGYSAVTPGVGAVAMPLPSRFNEVQFVICVAGPQERIRANEKDIIRLMEAAIRRHLPRPAGNLTTRLDTRRSVGLSK